VTRDPKILPRFVRAAPVLAAAAAAALALPGVRLPFLSDDWHLVASVARWPPPATPYEYVRPLYMGTYWLDRALWGPSPALFHLTNLLLLALCAALVVIVVRRLTGDGAIAGATGLLFALHPYHVENAAWIAVRGDPLYSLFVLASLWAYDRWRANRRGIPVAALACFAAALLAKETAVVLLPLFAVLAVVDPARRPDRAERIRGLAPFAAVATAHLLVVRPLLLAGGPGRSLTPGAGIAWLKHALGFAVAAVVPVDGEILAAHPFLCGGAAALGLGVLVVLALLHGRGRLPRFTLAAAAVFAVLLAPSIVGFQERYLYLPAAASCLLLASLLRAQRRAVMIVGTAALVLGWTYGCIRHWENWSEAASASRALVDDLVTASRDPDTQEIVIANVPFRIRGGSVAGDFQSALAFSGGRAIPVHGVAYVSYPSATDDFIAIVDRARGVAPDPSLVTLVVPNRPFSHYVGPLPPSESAYGSVSIVDSDEGSHVSIRLHRAPGRAVFTWTNGRLKRRL
jgi:hypothetical protein